MNFLLFLLDFWLDYQVGVWASVHHSGSVSMVYRGYKWPLIHVSNFLVVFTQFLASLLVHAWVSVRCQYISTPFWYCQYHLCLL